MSQCEEREKEYYDDDVGGNFRQTKRKEGRPVLCERCMWECCRMPKYIFIKSRGMDQMWSFFTLEMSYRWDYKYKLPPRRQWIFFTSHRAAERESKLLCCTKLITSMNISASDTNSHCTKLNAAIEWMRGGKRRRREKVEGIKITKFIYVSDIQFFSHILGRRFLRNWMLMFNVISNTQFIWIMAFLRVAIFTASGHNAIQFIFMSYI